jgi:hypothetical protein
LLFIRYLLDTLSWITASTTNGIPPPARGRHTLTAHGSKVVIVSCDQFEFLSTLVLQIITSSFEGNLSALRFLGDEISGISGSF